MESAPDRWQCRRITLRPLPGGLHAVKAGCNGPARFLGTLAEFDTAQERRDAIDTLALGVLYVCAGLTVLSGLLYIDHVNKMLAARE